MIAAILLVAAVTATPGPSGQAQKPPGAVREVVYKVSASLQISDSSESYGGFNSGSFSGPGSPDAHNASAPGSSGSTGGTGTVTVDVMAVGGDGSLGVRVTERWDNLTVSKPVTFDGIVTPDGTVEFDQSTINDVTRELLSYFGTHFAPAQGLAENTSWHVDQSFANGTVSTQYSVTALNGDVATIHKAQTIKGYDMSCDGTIQYQAADLVPLSGHVVKRMRSSFSNQGSEFSAGSSTARERTLTLRFDRISDTHVASSQ